MISCQSVLPSLALSSLLIFTIIFNLKLEHTGFQKALQYSMNIFSSVQSLSHVQFFATPWSSAHQASQSITNSWSLLKPMSTGSVMPSNHLILCHPLLLLPSIFPSIRSFPVSQFFASGGNAGDPGSIPRSGKFPAEGNGKQLQSSCLENSMDRGAQWAIVHEITKSWAWLSD